MATKFTGRPARPCRAHPVGIHYVNRLGGISCAACVPLKTGAAQPEVRLIADFGVWVVVTDNVTDMRDNVHQLPSINEILDETLLVPTQIEPCTIDRSNPSAPPAALVIVSLKLNWFLAAPTSLWADTAFEFDILATIDHGENRLRIPPGFYQRLTPDLFAWMVATVNRMASQPLNETQQAESKDSWQRLQEIANAAVECGVLGEWALDVGAWPIEVPSGFMPLLPARWPWAGVVARAWPDVVLA